MAKAEGNLNRLGTIDYKPGRRLINVLQKVCHSFYVKPI